MSTASLISTFREAHHRFLKAPLTTEMPHPATAHLSTLAQTDLTSAYQTLIKLDVTVIERMMGYFPQIERLQKAINTLQQGRIFILGCGASGRLGINLEYLWRRIHPTNADKIAGVIAGGDVALIASLEGFEDDPSLGIAELKGQGFSEHDLLIALSASGESPFILAACEYAREYCQHLPWLLMCNDQAILAMRDSGHWSQRYPAQTLALDVGPMALTGSTRMQATTAMTIALLLALFEKREDWTAPLATLVQHLKALDLTALSALTTREAAIYQAKEYGCYAVDADLALPLLADTTERAPTFNLPRFENQREHPKMPSPTYVVINNTTTENAWHTLLQRPPVCLNWPLFQETRHTWLEGYDLSAGFIEQRAKYLNSTQHLFQIKTTAKGIILTLENITCDISTTALSLAWQHLLLRLIFNMHSTLVMGILGLYEGNLMTFVNPSNHKLIDRAIRYVQFMAKHHERRELSYDEAATKVFTAMEDLKAGESVVKKALKI